MTLHPQTVHEPLFVGEIRMNIPVERQAGRAVTEEDRERFHIESAFNAVCRKGMAELVICMPGRTGFSKDFLVTVLHRSRLDEFVRAGEEPTRIIGAELPEIRHQAIRNRDAPPGGLAFRGGYDHLRFPLPLRSADALHRPADMQHMTLKIHITPLQAAQLPDTQSHIQRDQNTKCGQVHILPQITDKCIFHRFTELFRLLFLALRHCHIAKRQDEMIPAHSAASFSARPQYPAHSSPKAPRRAFC